MMNNGLFDSQMAPAAHGTVAAHTATELELHDLSQPAAPGIALAVSVVSVVSIVTIVSVVSIVTVCHCCLCCLCEFESVVSVALQSIMLPTLAVFLPYNSPLVDIFLSLSSHADSLILSLCVNSILLLPFLVVVHS